MLPLIRHGFAVPPSPEGNVINLRRFRRGRCPHRPFPTLQIRRSVVPKGYHSPRGDVGIAPYGAVVDASVDDIAPEGEGLAFRHPCKHQFISLLS